MGFFSPLAFTFLFYQIEGVFVYIWTSLVAQRLKHLPAMWETWVWSLGWKDPLEKEMATHSSILSGESHGWRSLVGYSPPGCKELDMTEQLHFVYIYQILLLLLLSCFIVSDSLRPHRQQPTRLLCPWDSPGKNTGIGCHFVLQCMQAC